MKLLRHRRLLLYAGLFLVISGALFVRLRQPGAPPDLTSLTLSELEERARSEPRNPWLPLELGVRYVRMGRKSAAETSFRRCLALSPDSLEARAYLGTMYSKSGRSQEAAQMFERAVARDRTFAAGHLELAKLYYDLSNYRRARVAADQYVALAPEDWQGVYLRGLIRFMEGDYERAHEDYSRSVALAPERPAGYLAAGLTYLYRPATPENLSAAQSWFERGLKVDPKDSGLHYYLGLTQFRQSHWPGAAASLQRSVQLDPDFTEAYYMLGQALRRLGKEEEAKRYLAGFSRLRVSEKEASARRMEQRYDAGNRS